MSKLFTGYKKQMTNYLEKKKMEALSMPHFSFNLIMKRLITGLKVDIINIAERLLPLMTSSSFTFHR